MLSTKEKNKIISKFKAHKKDTGSSAVQIALFTEQISQLTQHLKTHKKDTHSRRGLLRLVAKRKKLLNYLKQRDNKTYNKIIKSLGLKKEQKKAQVKAEKKKQS